MDHAREFQDEKMRMAAAKGTMTRKIQRLETALTDLKDLDKLDSTSIECLHGIAYEVNEIRSDVKETYMKMESINEILEKKLLLLDRVRGVPDVQTSLDDQSNVLGEYWGKWELLRKENAETLMRVDLWTCQNSLDQAYLDLMQEQAMIHSYILNPQ